MSKTIDERVVELDFDNSKFEKNVSQTMSTLEKLKQKLNFKGVDKGLEEISKATQNVKMDGLESSVDSLRAKFSALDVVGVTALANITNSAVNAGKKLVSALTIDQVTAGWGKYEQKTASIQTIMNATGKSIDEVNGYLDKLMWYSDETSYGFTDMTQSLGQLTSAGGDIDKLIPMIEGIANATAFAGKGASEFSRAIYNLNQSYSAGYLQYMDWKSLDLAGVSSKQLKQVFIDTAKALGKLDEEGKTAGGTLVEIGNFGQTLQEKWADTEVMEAAFGKFSELTEAAYEAVRSGEYDTASEAIAALADQYDEISVKAFSSAQEAKSFTEAIEATKDAVSSGWMNTSELIFGNYDEAKKLWTDMANSLWEIFAGGSESRNAIIGDAMNSKWDTLIEKIEETGVSAEDFQSKLKETAKEHGIAIDDLIKEYGSLGKVISAGKLSKSIIVETIKKLASNIETVGKATSVTTDKLEHFQGIVNKVIRGDFGNGVERMNKLAEAGENYATVQGLVNKIYERNGKTWSDTTLKAEDLAEVIGELSEKEIQSLGYTEEQAKALKELAEQAEKTGTPLNELIESLEKPSGRELLFSSIHNALEAIAKAISTVKSAWSEIFTGERMSAGIYSFLDSLNRITEKMIMSDDTADKLKRTIKGLVALIDVMQTVLGGGLRLAFRIVSQLLGAFDLDILDVTASLGDLLVKFRDWVNSVLDFESVFKKIAPYITDFIDNVKELLKTLSESRVLDRFVKRIKKLLNELKKLAKYDISNLSFDDIREAFSNIPDKMREIGRNIVEGLQNGIGDKIAEIVGKAREIGTKIIDTVKTILGIHSPSTVMFEIGENVVAGLVNGIAAGIKFVIDGVAYIGKYIIDAFKGIDFSTSIQPLSDLISKIGKGLKEFDWKKLLGIIPVGVVLLIVKEMYDFTKSITEGIDSVNNVINGISDIEKSISRVIDAKAFEIAAEGLEKVAKSIAILAGAVVVLSLVDETNLYRSVGVIVVLSIVLTVLAKAMASLQAASAKIGKDGFKLTGIKTGLLTIGAALLLLAATVKLMGNMKTEEIKRGFLGLAGVIGALVVVFAALQLLSLIPSKNIDLIGPMLLKVIVAIGAMALVCKLVSNLSIDEMKNGAVFASGFLAFVGILNLIAMLPSRNIEKLGGMLIKMVIAMGLMVGVCKLVQLLTPEEMIEGAEFAAGFAVFVGILVLVTKMGAGKQIAKLGGLLLSVSISLMLMIAVCKLVTNLSPEDLKNGALFLLGFMAFVWLLVKITTIGSGQKIAKVAATLLAMSIAVGILAGVAVLLSLLDPEALANGVVAVTLLSLAMAAMAAAVKGAGKSVGTIMALAIAVGVLAAAAVILSNIPVEGLASATLALTIIMGMFAIILKMTGQMPNVTLTLLVMAVAIGILGGVLYLLSSMPWESSLAAAGSLSAVMLVFAIAMRIIGGMQAPSGMALVAIGVMAMVVAALGGVLYLLQGLDPVQGIATVGVLTAFLAVLYIAVMATTLLSAPSLIGLGALAIVTLLVAALAGVLYALQGVDPTQAIQIVGVIAVFLAVMEAVCYASIGVGALAGLAVPGLLILVGFVAVLGLVIIGLASLAMDVVAKMPKLGSDLSAFIANVQPFIDGVQNIPDGLSDDVSKLTGAILKLAGTEILDAIANFFSGGKTIADLGDELKKFGEGMASFVSGSTNIDAAVSAISKIKDIQTAIEGVDLAGLDVLGDKLINYSTKVAGMNIVAIDASIIYAKRLVALANSLIGVDYSGVTSFNIGDLGSKLKRYADSVSSINIAAVGSSVSAMIKLKTFINGLAGLDTSGVSGFKKAISELGTVSIDNVVKAFEGGASKLYSSGSKLMKSVSDGMRSGQNGLMSAVKSIADNACNALKAKNTQFTSVGKVWVQSLINGMNSNKSLVKTNAESMANSASGGLKNAHDDFYDAGGYLAEGFANGIEDSAFNAKVKAAAMATAALEAAKEALGINSPSKEGFAIGEFFGMGFKNGIDSYSSDIYATSSSMAETAKNGLNNALEKVRNMVDGDMDIRPTISPVLDLSEVKSGVSAMQSMLDVGTSIGVNANLSGVSLAMNSRAQDSTNSDVVSAIGKLRTELANMQKNVYNIGGITYDDGSNVASAVETLVRAAKIERRV
nr:MAG TPA: tail tape measure [Bacteriophage sp.]